MLSKNIDRPVEAGMATVRRNNTLTLPPHKRQMATISMPLTVRDLLHLISVEVPEAATAAVVEADPSTQSRLLMKADSTTTSSVAKKKAP